MIKVVVNFFTLQPAILVYLIYSGRIDGDGSYFGQYGVLRRNVWECLINAFQSLDSVPS